MKRLSLIGLIFAALALLAGCASEALEMLMPEICKDLGLHGIPVISDRDMRPILRRHRIRSGGVFTGEDVEKIREETAAAALILGSVDFYSEGRNPELGLSLRMVDAVSLEILFMRSVSLTGADFAWIFGIGRVDSLSGLRAPLMKKLLQGLDIRSLGRDPADSSLPRGRTLAVLPFEDRSEYPFSGAIFTGILSSELFRRGYRLIDPAMLGELYVSEGRRPRGGVDLILAAGMREEAGADWIVTGGVDRFEPSTGDPLSAPDLEIHARMLDARLGRLIFMYGEERRGSPAGQVFGFEERRSLGRLAQEAAKRIADELTRKIEDELETQQ